MASAFKGRREDERLVTGRGRYSDDWDLPGQLYASFRRSDRAHALIRSLEVKAAERVSGVVAVVTGHDIAAAGFRTLAPIAPLVGRDGQKILIPERPLLPLDRVRFAGEEVAMVIAQSREAARDAADLVEVEFEELPVIIGFEKALAAHASVHSSIPNNICFDFEYGDAARTSELIERAEHVVRVTMESPRVAPTPMELRAALAWYDAESETYEIRCAHQGAFAMRDALAAMINVQPESSGRAPLRSPNIRSCCTWPRSLVARSNGSRPARKTSSPTIMAARSGSKGSWRSTRAAVSSRCEPTGCATRVPICRKPGHSPIASTGSPSAPVLIGSRRSTAGTGSS
jgi:hypothetical protein